MRKCISCGKEIENGNMCKECFESKNDDYNDYIPEYGDTYGKSKGTILINAKSFLFEKDEMSACSYMKGSYLPIKVDDTHLDFITAIKRALERIETEGLEEIYIYSSDFKAFRIIHNWREIDMCYVVPDSTNILKKLVITMWHRYDYVIPEEIIKDDFEVSKLPPIEFFKYEDYLNKIKRK